MSGRIDGMAIEVQVVIDCADPARLAAFWAKALGYRVEEPAEGFPRNYSSAVVDPAGAGPRFSFQRVPEPKQVKNRLHVDLNLAGGQRVPVERRRAPLQAEVERLTALGASLVEPVEEDAQYWIVMRDPEGNEFCIH